MLYFRALQYAGEQLRNAWDPWLRVAMMWFSTNMAVVNLCPEPKSSSRLIEAGPVHREGLIACLAMLVALPPAIFGAVALLSFIGHPAFRFWMTGGASIAFLALVGSAIASDVDWRIIPDAAVGVVHLGFWLGYKISTTSLAKSLDQSLLESNNVSLETVTVSEPSTDKSESSNGTDDAKRGILQQVFPPPLAAILFMIYWIAAMCRQAARSLVPFFSIPIRNTSYLDRCDTILTLTFGPVPYIVIAWAYLRNTRYRAWECLCGLVMGSTSLALLRITTSDSTWQSWTVDSSLAFLCLNIGLAVGFFSRSGPLEARFSKFWPSTVSDATNML